MQGPGLVSINEERKPLGALKQDWHAWGGHEVNLGRRTTERQKLLGEKASEELLAPHANVVRILCENGVQNTGWVRVGIFMLF